MSRRTAEHAAHVLRLRGLLNQALNRGITMASLGKASGVPMGAVYAFRRSDSMSPRNAHRLEAELVRRLGRLVPAPAPVDADDVLRKGLDAELHAKHDGQIPRLARTLGTTAGDLKRALAGGDFSSELETAARRMLGLEIGNGYAGQALPAGATTEERARRLVDRWGIDAIAFVLAKAGRKSDTGNMGG